MKAQGAADVQRQEAAAEMQVAQGAGSVQDQEFGRRSTLLGMQAQMAGGAAEAATAADQMSLQTDIEARNATTSAVTSGITNVAGAGMQLSSQASNEQIERGYDPLTGKKIQN